MAAALDDSGESSGPDENITVHRVGEIISIRPSELLETTEALRESEARLRALLSSLDDLVFELDENGLYLSIWTTDETLLVAPPSELLGRTTREALGNDIGHRIVLAVRRVLGSGRPEVFEYRLEVPAGVRWFQGRLAPIVGSSYESVCMLVRDITEQKAAEEARDDAERRLRHQALHDGLTGLPNRVFFRDRLDHALRRTRRKHEELVVLMLDVDRFKDVNDTFGHAAGDEVLQEVARRLGVVTREGDSIGRLGGDEFAILLPGASEDEGLRVTRRVFEALVEQIVVGVTQVSIDISVGLALFPRDGTDAEALVHSADTAMYAAKRAKPRSASPTVPVSAQPPRN